MPLRPVTRRRPLKVDTSSVAKPLGFSPGGIRLDAGAAGWKTHCRPQAPLGEVSAAILALSASSEIRFGFSD